MTCRDLCACHDTCSVQSSPDCTHDAFCRERSFRQKSPRFTNHQRQVKSSKLVPVKQLDNLFGSAAIASFVDWLDWLIVNRPERFPLRRFAGWSLAWRRLLNRIQRSVGVLLPRFACRGEPFLIRRSALSDGRTILHWRAFPHRRTLLHRRTSLRTSFTTSASRFLLRITPFGNSGAAILTWGSFRSRSLGFGWFNV